MTFLPASPQDIPELLRLVNGAYRGESSKQGWTTEAHLLEGTIRTDAATLESILAQPAARILKYPGAGGRIEACVYLHPQEQGLYLGMLTVEPGLQGGGIGKKLLAAAEDFARANGCRCIFMKVFSARTELVAWYERHGYRPTGEVIPYQADPKYGVPTRELEFQILQKDLD